MDKDHVILCLAHIEVIIRKYIHVYPERQEILTDIQEIRKEVQDDRTNAIRVSKGKGISSQGS